MLRPETKLIGRQREKELLSDSSKSERAELVIVYGRRRVGKSALLQSFIKTPHDYYFEGLQDADTPEQIAHFMRQLAKQQGTLPMLATRWHETFEAFSQVIGKGKHFVVFDEFPWMAAERHELVSLIKYFWDNVWKINPRLTLVLCGSVASFMVKHVLHSKALHNRKTLEIRLEPLNATEAKQFFKNFRSPYEIIKFLMIFGGIPKYLEQIDPRKSLVDNLDRHCFQRNGFFTTEFETLFKEQFRVVQTYKKIVKALANHSMSREKLAQRLKTASGGGLAVYFDNLEQAEFIKSWVPFSPHRVGTKTKRYALWDDWLHFYFTYMDSRLNLIQNNIRGPLFWGLASSSFESYCGIAFERFCLKNFVSILATMNMELSQIRGFGPYFRQGSRKEGEKSVTGLQIDILSERQGGILMAFECKFKTKPVGLEVIGQFERKLECLKPPKNYTIEKILIAPGGVTRDLNRSHYFHHILDDKAIL